VEGCCQGTCSEPLERRERGDPWERSDLTSRRNADSRLGVEGEESLSLKTGERLRENFKRSHAGKNETEKGGGLTRLRSIRTAFLSRAE